MKKSIICLALGALLLSSCAGKDDKKIQEDSMKIATLTEEYNEATSFNDSLMLLMGDIYTGLDSINAQEGLLYNMGSGDNTDRRAEIRQNLANIKARLNANKQVLDQMQAKLDASGNQNAVLNKTITQLKQRLESQDKKIADLETQLATAREEITNLSNQVTETQEQVKTETAAKEQAQAEAAASDAAANTVYYAIGTNKELKKNGLLEKKFLGQTKVLKGDEINLGYFTKVDKRNLKSIPTNSKKVKIWTSVPQESYRIVENADKTKTINILNPNEFWKYSPYLVIQVD